LLFVVVVVVVVLLLNRMSQDSETKVPKLTNTNFATEFKDAFLAHVLHYGDPGLDLASNQGLVDMREPTENDMVLVLDPVTNRSW
jgi:hypothetical protein